MVRELNDWSAELVMGNDSCSDFEGTYRVLDGDTKEIMAQGKFNSRANENLVLEQLPLYYSDKKLLILEWETAGKRFRNHYLAGSPAFSLKTYQRWVEEWQLNT